MRQRTSKKVVSDLKTVRDRCRLFNKNHTHSTNLDRRHSLSPYPRRLAPDAIAHAARRREATSYACESMCAWESGGSQVKTPRVLLVAPCVHTALPQTGDRLALLVRLFSYFMAKQGYKASRAGIPASCQKIENSTFLHEICPFVKFWNRIL